MNYLMFDGKKYRLVAEEDQCCEAVQEGVRLADIAVGNTCEIGGREYIVCEHTSEGTVLLMKELLCDEVEFGQNNNYNGSNVDNLCNEFAEELEKVVGTENIVLHMVDLTADDGLKDYGFIERRVSLFTANQYRKYCDILENHRVKTWTWTATAYSTYKHDDNIWIKCVSPRGDVNYDSNYDYFGVRPFLILKSSIFVSQN